MLTFACRLKNVDHETNVTARTAGKAKSEYLSRIRDVLPDAEYPDVRCRSLGGCITDSRFKRTAIYRGVPFARIGMRIKVGDRMGTIVGSNCSANFDVVFDGENLLLNCHPNWMTTYYGKSGEVLADFNEEQRGVR